MLSDIKRLASLGQYQPLRRDPFGRWELHRFSALALYGSKANIPACAFCGSRSRWVYIVSDDASGYARRLPSRPVCSLSCFYASVGE